MGLSKDLFMQMRELENKALDGDANELETYIEFQKVKTAAENSMRNIKQYAITEFERHGNKSVSLCGCTVQKSQSGRYSYKHLEQWNEVNGQAKAIEKQAQEAYKQSLKGIDLIDENGEVIQPAEYKPNSESLKIIINK